MKSQDRQQVEEMRADINAQWERLAGNLPSLLMALEAVKNGHPPPDALLREGYHHFLWLVVGELLVRQTEAALADQEQRAAAN